MSNKPAFLKEGDQIAIIAPARKISSEELAPFIELAKDSGFEIIYHNDLFHQFHQFGGTDDQRATDFQRWLDDTGVKAIISARGGYGTARIIDQLDFSGFIKNPKWLIGFSDFTVVHNYVNHRLDLPSLHASMPIFLKPDSVKDVVQSFEALFKILKGELPVYQLPEHHLNIKGNCKGKLCGGNLSVIYSQMGSASEIETQNSILFLEDLDEYLYHIDRMMVCLKRAGKLGKLNGVLIGHMNDMHDNKIPFGAGAEEIIYSHCKDLNIPLYFGINSGHLNPNLPLIMNAEVEIDNNSLIFGKF